MLLSTGNLYVTQHFGQLYFMAVFTLDRIAFAPARKPLQLIYFNYSCYFIDRLVLIGNHRDAWVFGGIDPSSGTACMMEVAKALGQKFKQGRKQTFFKLCLRFSVLLREIMAPETRTAQLCSHVDIYHVAPSAWHEQERS